MLSTHKHEMTARKGRHFFLSFDILLPVVTLVFITVGFYLFDWDLRFQGLFYDVTKGWHLGDQQVFRWVYHYGNLPALLLAVLGLLGFILSYSRQSLIKWRKVGLYLVLVMALGPGLVVNTLLKDQWGRPRPRNTIEFGGKYGYEYPLEIDTSSSGKSFPCGHATMGFYFFALALVLRHRRKIASVSVGLFAAAYGSLIGLARIAQGGHYLSDVIWAGFLIYLTSYSIYRIMKMDITIWFIPRSITIKKLSLAQKTGLYLLGTIIVFAVMLASPYESKKDTDISGREGASTASGIVLELRQTDLILTFADKTILLSEANGFGMPGSKTKYRIGSKTDPKLIQIQQEHSGIFTEIEDKLSLSLDSLKIAQIRINNLEGTTHLDLSKLVRSPSYSVVYNGQSLRISLPKSFSDSLQVISKQTPKTLRRGLRITRQPSPYMIEMQSGTLSID